MGAEKKKIFLATCLKSDNWVSMHKYVSSLVKELSAYKDYYDIKLLAPEGSGITQRHVRALVRKFLYPMTVKRALRGGDAHTTLLHVTDQFYAYLLPEYGASVVTCHDIADFKVSDLNSSELTRWKNRVAHLKKANLVFSDSENTAKDLRNILEIEPERIMVNHLGVDEYFAKLDLNRSLTNVGKLLKERAHDSVLALHVGSNLSRKNIPVLLKTIAGLKQSGVSIKLVKIGDSILSDLLTVKAGDLGRQWDPQYLLLAKSLGIEDDIIDLGFVSNDELVEAYNICDFLLFPSSYEGFGFPVLEAQASGLPTVISNSSSLSELGGDASLYHDHYDVNAAVTAVQQLLKNSNMRMELIDKGFKNVKRFTWKRHVERLMEGYNRVLLNGNTGKH